jgi:hypothetical protein
LAVASIIFRRHGGVIGVGPDYAATLLDKARKMYNFANKYQRSYTSSIRDAEKFYKSWSGFKDELAWGALWLHLAELEARTSSYRDSYLQLAQNHLSQAGFYHGFSWDNKTAGSRLLMAKIKRSSRELSDFEMVFFTDQWMGKVTRTQGGLRFLQNWGSLRYSANAAFLAFVYSDCQRSRGNDPFRIERWAKGQIDYALGKNPRNSSYMVGFGNNPPVNPHHRSATGAPYDLNKPQPNAHILFGALVGGPQTSSDFSYEDKRANYIANEVAIDYNAAFTGALARLSREFGGSIITNFPNVNSPRKVIPKR